MAQQGIDEKLEGYLNGDLTGAERSAFERDMALDPALAAEVEQQRRLTESLAHIRLRRQSDAAVATARQILVRRRRNIVGLGALCILVALVWYFIQNRPALSPPPGGTPAEKTNAPAQEPVSPESEDPAPSSPPAPPIAQRLLPTGTTTCVAMRTAKKWTPPSCRFSIARCATMRPYCRKKAVLILRKWGP